MRSVWTFARIWAATKASEAFVLRSLHGTKASTCSPSTAEKCLTRSFWRRRWTRFDREATSHESWNTWEAKGMSRAPMEPDSSSRDAMTDLADIAPAFSFVVGKGLAGARHIALTFSNG
jgi:hypothetical protein